MSFAKFAGPKLNRFLDAIRKKAAVRSKNPRVKEGGFVGADRVVRDPITPPPVPVKRVSDTKRKLRLAGLVVGGLVLLFILARATRQG